MLYILISDCTLTGVHLHVPWLEPDDANAYILNERHGVSFCHYDLFKLIFLSSTTEDGMYQAGGLGLAFTTFSSVNHLLL